MFWKIRIKKQSNLAGPNYYNYLIVHFLGIVDKLLSEFEKRVCSTKKAGEKFMDNYLKKVL